MNYQVVYVCSLSNGLYHSSPCVCLGDVDPNVPIKWEYKEAEVTSDECYHSWVPYVGLWETYEYCRSCDVKRETVV